MRSRPKPESSLLALPQGFEIRACSESAMGHAALHENVGWYGTDLPALGEHEPLLVVKRDVQRPGLSARLQLLQGPVERSVLCESLEDAPVADEKDGTQFDLARVFSEERHDAFGPLGATFRLRGCEE